MRRARAAACCVVLAAVVWTVSLAPALAYAQTPARDAPPLPSPTSNAARLPSADCHLLATSDAARVLGFPVEAPDESSARGGICFFATRAISQEGTLAYALVTTARVGERRAFFLASARRCGGVVETSPNANICKSYVRLAEAKDLDAYFEARTDDPDAIPVAKLGERAVAAADALYVRRGPIVFECAVRLGAALDLPRSIELARLLLDRTPQP